MPDTNTPTESETNESNGHLPDPDWKVMVYFASDNPLSPLLVSQLKALKDAGFQLNTDVLVYFDPMEIGVPTKLYNVNIKRKASLQESLIGDGADPFVRNMVEDEIPEQLIPESIKNVLSASGRNEPNALATLSAFIDFGLTVRPAKNYILFLAGHGMLIGNDAFLPDNDPISAITLKQLQTITEKFGRDDQTSLRLLAFHSCSMSSIELAYQLKGTAEYLIATQGPAFVNAWPYRQLLKKTFNMVEGAQGRGADVDVQTLVEKLYYLTLFNATDFMSVGYSADLALINLKTNVVERVKTKLPRLVQELKRNLERDAVKELIQLAHLESQSFFEENYTDLFDFCDCLRNRCLQRMKALAGVTSDEIVGLVNDLNSVAEACFGVMTALGIVKSDDRHERFKGLVVHEDNFGSEFQFSAGLSIYFPWTEPLNDKPVTSDAPRVEIGGRLRSNVIRNYNGYAFTEDFKSDSDDVSWLSFLLKYFDDTKRPAGHPAVEDKEMSDDNKRDTGRAELSFNPFGALSGKRIPELGTRTPEHGISCDCPSIKNFPIDTQRSVRKFYISPGALTAFTPSQKDDPILGDT